MLKFSAPASYNLASCQGFSLVEILISLLVLSGALATMFSGFDTSSRLELHASFESEAAFLAEREMELLKADLLSGRIKTAPAAVNSRFRHKPGWKSYSIITAPDQYGAVRVVSTVKKGERIFKLESFLFVPEMRASK